MCTHAMEVEMKLVFGGLNTEGEKGKGGSMAGSILSIHYTLM